MQFIITRFLWTVSFYLWVRHVSCRTVFLGTGLWLGSTWPLLVMSSATSTSAGWLWRTVVCTNVQQRTEWGAPRTLHLSGFTVMSHTLMDYVAPTVGICINSSLQEAQVLQAVVCSSRPKCVPSSRSVFLYTAVFLQIVLCPSRP